MKIINDYDGFINVSLLEFLHPGSYVASDCFCKVTGGMLNRATGFVLEIWSVYLFKGLHAYIEVQEHFAVAKNYTDHP